MASQRRGGFSRRWAARHRPGGTRRLRRVAELEWKIGQFGMEVTFKRGWQHFRNHHPLARRQWRGYLLKKSSKPARNANP
jgi:hypothetical protein